ncbi:hypothetical protein TRFO_15048 [Tritrichomonas foetus]|uniref:Leucine Rich Repeat family protein n=1 Tax=Tritrichomonas foetus TaxID=1144522 RepID=A0A1J4KTB7_9EUKA|nr:hypothetical protein TRFO_15048 [Tritrichomonas foetus]|eukprot:OHT14529.1 hypothetical protein TRFO_15048 [Tritrichomonas foetus]
MDTEFPQIIHWIRRNDPFYTQVIIKGNILTDPMINLFISAMNQNNFVTKVYFITNSLSDDSCKLIFSLLLSKTQITDLTIDNNNVSDDSIIYLSEILKKISSPQNKSTLNTSSRKPLKLAFRCNKFGVIGAKALASAFSKNPPVEELDIQFTPISDEGCFSIATSLISNSTLNSLNIAGCGCNDKGCSALYDSLMENHTLTNIYIHDPLNSTAVYNIGLLLIDKLCCLKELHLSRCSLKPISIMTICQCLCMNKSLKILDLSFNSFGDEGGVFIFQLLKMNKTLEHIYINGNFLTSLTASYIACTLLHNKTLKTLDIGDNLISNSGFWSLTVALHDNKTIESVNFRSNAIQSLIKSNNDFDSNLSHDISSNNNNISVSNTLYLNNDVNNHVNHQVIDNNIDNQEYSDYMPMLLNSMTWKMLSPGVIINELIELNNSLKKINIGGNILGDESIYFLAERLKTNSNIVELYLSDVKITGEGVFKLCKCLEKHETIQILELSKNNLRNPISMKSVSRLLARNHSLKTLSLNSCSINDEGCFYLSDGIIANDSLVSLYLSKNEIHLEGIKKLINALLANFSILNFQCSKNPFIQEMNEVKTIKDEESSNDEEIENEAVIDELHMLNIMMEIKKRNIYHHNNILIKDMTKLIDL